MFPNRVVLFFVLFFSLNSFLTAQNADFVRNSLLQKSRQATKYFREQDFEKSLLLSREVLKQALLMNDSVLIAASYNTIGSNYNEFSEFDKSIEYYKKALFYANKTTNDSLRFKANNNLGNLYCFEKGQYELGIKHYKKAIFHSQNISNHTYTLLTSLNLTWAYFDKSNFEEGLLYLNYCNANFKQYGNDALSVVYQMINGMYSSHIGNYKKARVFFEKAISLGYEFNELNDVSYAHNEFSKMLFRMGNYKEAYIHLNKFNEIKDKIYNEDKLFKASIAGLNL